MPSGAVGLGLGAAQGIMQAQAAGKASKQEAAANQAAGAQQAAQFAQTRNDLAPYQQAGRQALGQYQGLLTGNIDPTGMLTNSPGYKFQLQQGLDAAQMGAAARGGLLSGATQKALTSYGQGLASQQYNQFMDRLQGLAGMGQNASNQIGGFGQNAANMQGQYTTGAGQAQAGGTMGRMQGYLGGLGTGVGTYRSLGGNFGIPMPGQAGG